MGIEEVTRDKGRGTRKNNPVRDFLSVEREVPKSTPCPRQRGISFRRTNIDGRIILEQLHIRL
jgi:hypothetical protein